MARISYLYTIAVLFIIVVGAGCATKNEQESDHFEKAKQFISQEKYREAVLELRNVIQLDPDNDEARLELGKVYMALEEVPMAIQAYDDAVKTNPDNIEAHIKLGQVLLLAENTLNARRAAKIVLEKDPKNLDGLLLLAAIQVQEKNSLEAIKTLQETIGIYPEAIRARLFLAQLFNSIGEKEKACQTYLNAISIDPSAPGPYINLIRMFANDDQWKNVDEILDELFKKSRRYDPALLELAQFCEVSKTPEVAEKLFQHAVSTAPSDSTDALTSMGAYYARHNRNDEALRAFNLVLIVNSKDVEVLTNIANLYLNQGDLDSAETTVRKALDINPDDIPANYIQGVIAFFKKDFVGASDRFDFIVKNNPNHAMAYYYKALCLLEDDTMEGSDTELFRAAAGYQGDTDAWITSQMEENLEKAVELAPSFLPARLILARIHLRDGQMEAARQQIDSILNISPDHEQARALQGSLMILQRNLKGAEALCREALGKKPDDPQWLTRLGVVLFAMGRGDDALAVCRKALAVNPRQFDALQMMVDYHVKKAQFDDALNLCETYREKMEGNPSSVAIIDNMAGGVCLSQRNIEAARRFFQNAVEGAPDFLSPRMSLARMLISEERYDEAVSKLEDVLKVNERYLPACMTLGDVYYTQGNKKQAEKYYSKALKIDRSYAPAANNLAFVLSTYDSRLAEALQSAQTAVNKMPNNSAFRDTLGWIHYRLGNLYMATKELEKSLSLNPNNALTNYHMGLVCYKNKEFDKARIYIKKSLEINPEFEEAKDARAMLDR